MELSELFIQRDIIIRKLWIILNDINHKVNIDDFTDEDLVLWTSVTEHSAIQKTLDKIISDPSLNRK